MEMPNSGSLEIGYDEVDKSLKTWRAARKARLAAGEGAIARRTKRVTGANAKEATSAFDDSVRNAEAAADRTSALLARRTQRTAIVAGSAASMPILATSVPIAVHNKTKPVKKADEAKELPIPEWARSAASVPTSAPVMNPLNMYAGSKMMGLGARKVAGKWTPPWRKKKITEGALEVAQGRSMIYSPIGHGRSYS